MQVDWLIVGAGFTGCVLAERIASGLGQTVLLTDRRGHLGGNAFDAPDDHGVWTHRYGAHIFHTNAARVVAYLDRFTAWRPYVHHVLADLDGRRVPLPVNLNTLDALLPPAEARRAEAALVATYGADARVPILALREATLPELRHVAEVVYETIFLGYTRKQWGCDPDALDAVVTARVPLRVSRDDRYFRDAHQALPADGYNAMFARMIDHPAITVALDCPFEHLAGSVRYRRLVYTGPIDAYFGGLHGELPYRSLRFEFAHHPYARHQDVAVVNYPGPEPFTRVLEFKHLTGQETPGTTVATEYPLAHVPGENEPYYPVPCAAHRARYALYRAEAARSAPDVVFAGRLADYRYYDMDQSVARALAVFTAEIAR